jgi:asparagine synthase (glutamine-hydrolysing)
MCGIAGFCNLSNSGFCIDEALLHAMQKTLEHRGPNGYRTWSSHEHGLALVHRRLSIVDLSDAGFQPMFDQQKTVAVCCNGEIYNHPELRKELEAYGHMYQSNSDTETIVHAYKQWGIQGLNRLDGMFAIVIFDFKKNELYLVRDRIGIKPLYFSMQGGVLSFASEIKALWPLPWVEKTINRNALYHYLTYMATPAPMTLYAGIYKLPASFYIKVDARRQVTFHEWYTPIIKTTAERNALMCDEQFCVDNIRSLLRNSVKQQMMSDVPFGAFLSGGIDSSLNVALMSECIGKVKTFNVSCADGPEYSEVEWARKVAHHYGTDHHEIVISEQDAFNFFEKMVYHQDEPLADCVCVPLYYVSKLLHDSGVTVAQVGEGSDELFCGYSMYARYLDTYRPIEFSKHFTPRFIKRGCAQLYEAVFPKRIDHIELMNNWSHDRAFFWGGAIVFSETQKNRLGIVQTFDTKDPIVEQIFPHFDQRADSNSVVEYHLNRLHTLDPQADYLKGMIYLELKQRLSELLLMRVDKMTMATSVEARVPFLDHHLVEFALQIPQELKYKDGVTKYILKKACEGILPHDVIYRKKMGFAAPITRWMRQGALFREHMQDMVHSQSSGWRDYLNFGALEQMLDDHGTGKIDYSLHLWVVHNVMGCDVQ